MSSKVLGIFDKTQYFWDNISLAGRPFAIIDILIVAALIYWIYFLLRETRALRILYGLILILLTMLIGQLLHLTVFNFIMKYFITMLLVAIPVIFQPELRAALEKVGRTKFVGQFKALRKKDIEFVIEELNQAVITLSEEKVGALIVITRATGLRDIIETGVKLYANLSAELLLSIFRLPSPLHDKAVIIGGTKILAASCTLPLADESLSSRIGTRHRAALGLAYQCDALVIVVSEQTGKISIAFGNRIKEVSREKFKEILEGELIGSSS